MSLVGEHNAEGNKLAIKCLGFVLLLSQIAHSGFISLLLCPLWDKVKQSYGPDQSIDRSVPCDLSKFTWKIEQLHDQYGKGIPSPI
jgi:hypothetical protein